MADALDPPWNDEKTNGAGFEIRDMQCGNTYTETLKTNYIPGEVTIKTDQFADC
jgi:hypothetical protein